MAESSHKIMMGVPTRANHTAEPYHRIKPHNAPVLLASAVPTQTLRLSGVTTLKLIMILWQPTESSHNGAVPTRANQSKAKP